MNIYFTHLFDFRRFPFKINFSFEVSKYYYNDLKIKVFKQVQYDLMDLKSNSTEEEIVLLIYNSIKFSQ